MLSPFIRSLTVWSLETNMLFFGGTCGQGGCVCVCEYERESEGGEMLGKKRKQKQKEKQKTKVQVQQDRFFFSRKN